MLAFDEHAYDSDGVGCEVPGGGGLEARCIRWACLAILGEDRADLRPDDARRQACCARAAGKARGFL